MMGSALPWLSGSRVLVLNWRDVRHPLAGGAEQYMHEIGRRWAAAGVDVTWCTAGAPGLPAAEELDGMHVIRSGRTFSVYPRAAVRLLRSRHQFDAVVDCQNGIPFFSPVFAGRAVPVVQVVHHVHQDQFSDRFPAPLATVGRVLEGRAARLVYGRRAVAAVSPSTRYELRRRLGFTGPIYVVPNGQMVPPAGQRTRAPDPTVVVVTRLVPHKRIDLLLSHVANVVSEMPQLRVEIVGDGPERARLQGIAADLAIQSTVTFHGRLSDAERDLLLSRAWATTSTSAAEGWGCSVLEAAAWGVPCIALRVPGIRDSVIAGRTGWLEDDPRSFDATMLSALRELQDERRSRAMAVECRVWARSFSWDRSAELLGRVILAETGRTTRHARPDGDAHPRERRRARSDMAVVADFARPRVNHSRMTLRCTDEVLHDEPFIHVMLHGCDESDGALVLKHWGATDIAVRRAETPDLLTGPVPLPFRAWHLADLGAAGTA
jgi:glycosyltransferase involved in cell wall biosynthesis